MSSTHVPERILQNWPKRIPENPLKVAEKTGKTGFRSRAPIGKEFTPIGTGKIGFRSLAPIGKEFTSIGTGKTGFRSLAPVGKEFTHKMSFYHTDKK
jgi:hypothetical protein